MHPTNRWEFIDFDYIDKLTHEEKLYLSDFYEEYLSGNTNHDGRPVLHPTWKDLKPCYDRNNARNRDTLAISKTQGLVVGDEGGLPEKHIDNVGETEDNVLTLLDLKDEIKNAKLVARKNNKKNIPKPT